MRTRTRLAAAALFVGGALLGWLTIPTVGQEKLPETKSPFTPTVLSATLSTIPVGEDESGRGRLKGGGKTRAGPRACDSLRICSPVTGVIRRPGTAREGFGRQEAGRGGAWAGRPALG